MKIESKYIGQKVETVKDFKFGTVLWIASSPHQENNFPNCSLLLTLRTYDGATMLGDGYCFSLDSCKGWKAIEANVKIVNGD